MDKKLLNGDLMLKGIQKPRLNKKTYINRSPGAEVQDIIDNHSETDSSSYHDATLYTYVGENDVSSSQSISTIRNGLIGLLNIWPNITRVMCKCGMIIKI